jgi:MarR family transcriptional regulator, lower aerobic nicotinate degradation pathway regulator
VSRWRGHGADSVVADVQDTLLAPLSPAEHEQFTRLLGWILAHHANSQRVRHD